MVDGSGLENQRGASLRGFESHPLRSKKPSLRLGFLVSERHSGATTHTGATGVSLKSMAGISHLLKPPTLGLSDQIKAINAGVKGMSIVQCKDSLVLAVRVQAQKAGR